MRILLYLTCLFISLASFSQKRNLSYFPSHIPVFLNQNGDTMSKALVGGLNQPQFQVLDINNDGKKDLIVHDRTGGMFLPFINTGSNDITIYKYSPEYVSCFPKISKGWVLFVDYDKDGKEDLWASIDFKVVLQRNVTKAGDKKVSFKQISPYLRAYFYKGYPDPSLDTSNLASNFNNIPAIGDLDFDGDIDLFSYQSNEGNLILYRNRTVDFSLLNHPPSFDLADLCWGNFRDTAFDGVKFLTCPYKYYRQKHGGGSNLLWFDNDNDGDMDLLMGNADGKNLIFLKNGKKEYNLKQDSMISYVGNWPTGTTPVLMSSFPAAYMLDADGDGINDILVAPNQFEQTSKISQTKQVWFYKNKGSNSLPDFKLEKQNYFTDEILDHGAYTAPVLVDIDNDQDLDLLLASNGDHAKTGDKTFNLVLYRNIGGKKNPVFKLEDEDLWKLSKDSLLYLNVTFGDLNSDGLPDMLAGDLLGGLTYYKNIGTASAWAFSTPTKNYLDINVGQNSSVQLVDADKDGKLDVIVGEKEGNFNYFKNTGTTFVPKFTLADDTLGNFITNEFSYDINPPGFLYDGFASGLLSDLDGDGNFDMVFGGLEGRIRVMKFGSVNQKFFNEDTTVLYDSAYKRYNKTDFGNLSKPAVGDLDGDGVMDIIIGNDRGGINFLKGKVEIVSAAGLHKQNAPIVFPNPSKGELLNIVKKSNEAFAFALFDMNGRELLKETSAKGVNTHVISLQNLAEGLYMLQSVSENKEVYYTKVIVSR